jgi:hypothetical protein
MLPVVRKCGWNDDDIVEKLDGPTASVVLSIAYMSLLKIPIGPVDKVNIFGKDVLLEQQILAASAYQVPEVCETLPIIFQFTYFNGFVQQDDKRYIAFPRWFLQSVVSSSRPSRAGLGFLGTLLKIPLDAIDRGSPLELLVREVLV